MFRKERLERFPLAVAFTSGLLGAWAIPSLAWADNPIVQTRYTADPAPLVHDGTLYLYTTHDEDQLVNDFFTMNDWRVYSSTDVVNWTDHGSPLHYRQFSWAGGDAWAGQVIYRGGTFYFYVPLRRPNGGNAIGVATSDSPTGPFEDALGEPLVTSNCGDIDPTVFIDDDDQAYLYWGNPNLCYVRLNEDMVSYQGDVVRVPLSPDSFGARRDDERPTSYEEGPWFFKRQDLYYMVFAAGPISEHIGYSTSTSPTGPWSYRGVVMPTEGGSFTNHPGVVDYKGKSLFFYHNGALPGGGGFHRSVSVEEFAYGADGTIPQMKMSTQGAGAVDVLNPFVRTEAETMAWGVGVETEVCSEGGMQVTDIDDGDSIKVEEVEFGIGADSFELRVAVVSAGASVELHLDALDGPTVGTCALQSSGNDETWTTQSCEVSDATGKHDLFLVFRGGGFDFNWWQFTGPGDPGVVGAGGAPNPVGEGGASGAGGSATSLGAGGKAGGQSQPVGTSSGGNVSPSVDASGGSEPTSPVQPMPPASTTSPTGSAAPAPSPGPVAPLGPGASSTSDAPGAVANPAAPFATSAPESGSDAGADSEGCGCRLVWHAPRASTLAAVTLLGALALLRRRRRFLSAGTP